MYTRETPDDRELSWDALALWRTLLVKFDRSGLLPLRNGWHSVAKAIGWPSEVVLRAGPELINDGRVRMVEVGLFAPNFSEAQTASKSDKVRQRESRERRRTRADSMQDIDITTTGHEQSQPVTSSHSESRNVTLRSALLCSASLPVALLIPPNKSAAKSESKSDTPKRTRSGSKHVLPSDWRPERSEANLKAEQVAEARGVDLGLELQKLHDWAQSNNAKKADWDSTWRNWTRNARPQNRSSQLSGLDAVRSIAEGTS